MRNFSTRKSPLSQLRKIFLHEKVSSASWENFFYIKTIFLHEKLSPASCGQFIYMKNSPQLADDNFSIEKSLLGRTSQLRIASLQIIPKKELENRQKIYDVVCFLWGKKKTINSQRILKKKIHLNWGEFYFRKLFFILWIFHMENLFSVCWEIFPIGKSGREDFLCKKIILFMIDKFYSFSKPCSSIGRQPQGVFF